MIIVDAVSDNESKEVSAGESAMNDLESARVILEDKLDNIESYIENELKLEQIKIKVSSFNF